MNFSNKKVLIVDDEVGFQEVLGEELALIGVKFEAVGEVSAAVDRLGKEKFDLVVSDANMPGENGLKLLEIVKQRHQIPFIIISGYSDVYRGNESSVRADATFVKPFHMDDFIERIKKLLGESQK